jgi:Domain of unknown function (DUF4296)
MKKIVVFLFFYTLLSCSDKAIEKPKNLIDETTMENILYDLSLIQAIKGHDYKLLPKKSIDPQKYIYQKYKIDSSQFAQSNKYYSSDIDGYKKMYDRVIEKIKAEKKVLDAKVSKEFKEKQKKTKDSISKIKKLKRPKIIAKG